MARTESSFTSPSVMRASSTHIAYVMAFRVRGRLKTTVAMAPSCWTRMSLLPAGACFTSVECSRTAPGRAAANTRPVQRRGVSEAARGRRLVRHLAGGAGSVRQHREADVVDEDRHRRADERTDPVDPVAAPRAGHEGG